MKFYSICNAIVFTVLLVFSVQALPLTPEDVTRFDWLLPAQPADQSFFIELQAPSRVHVTDTNPLGQGFSVYDNDHFVDETTNTRESFFKLDKGLHLLTIRPKGTFSDQESGYLRIVLSEEQQVDCDEPVIPDCDTYYACEAEAIQSKEVVEQVSQEEPPKDNGILENNTFEENHEGIQGTGVLGLTDTVPVDDLPKETYTDDDNKEDGNDNNNECDDEKDDNQEDDNEGDDNEEEDNEKDNEKDNEEGNEEDNEKDNEEENEGDENDVEVGNEDDQDKDDGEECQDEQDEYITLGDGSYDFDYLKSLIGGPPQDMDHTITLTTTVTVDADVSVVGNADFMATTLE